jgi:hypothetical protein
MESTTRSIRRILFLLPDADHRQSAARFRLRKPLHRWRLALERGVEVWPRLVEAARNNVSSTVKGTVSPFLLSLPA